MAHGKPIIACCKNIIRIIMQVSVKKCVLIRMSNSYRSIKLLITQLSLPIIKLPLKKSIILYTATAFTKSLHLVAKELLEKTLSNGKKLWVSLKNGIVNSTQ